MDLPSDKFLIVTLSLTPTPHALEQLSCVLLFGVRSSVVFETSSATVKNESLRRSSRQRSWRHTDGVSWSFEGYRDIVGHEGGNDTDTHTHTHLKAIQSHRLRVNFHTYTQAQTQQVESVAHTINSHTH